MTESDYEKHFDAGCVAYADYRYAIAAKEFGACTELRPGEPQACFRLAIALTRCNQLPAAWGYFLASLPGLVLDAFQEDKSKNRLFGLKLVDDLCKAAEQAGRPAEEVTYVRALIHLAKHTLIPFDKDEASAAMRELGKLQNNSMAFVFRGLTMADANDALQAIQQFSRAIEIDPNLMIAYRHRARHHATAGNHREAIEDAAKALALSGPNGSLFRLEAEEYLVIGKFEEAVAVASQAIPLCTDKRRVYFIRGAAYYHLENAEAAMADFDEAIRLTTSDRAGIVNVHSIWMRNEAINTFDERVRVEPDDHLALCNRGMAYYLRGCPTREQSDWSKAESDLTSAIEKNPNCARYYLSRAILFSQFKHAEARLDCNQAIALEPTLVDAYLVRANLAADPETKKREFAEAFEVAPNSNDLLRAHTFYYSTRGNPQDKLTAVNLQIAKCNGAVPGHLWNERGQLRLKENDATGAMEDFVRALMFNPEHVDALRGRMAAWFQQGNWDQAKLDEAELSRLEAPVAQAQF